jgi:Fur family transcriptional regulator, ferric uptake regulator
MAGKDALDIARERIRSTGARMTVPRVQVLAAMLGAGRVLSHHEIEHLLGPAKLDRVTLYRVLEWLVEEGLAHRIAGSDRVWRFSVVGEAHEAHAHFQCSGCGKMMCLDELSARKLAVHLPRGCRPERIEVTVTGVCAECAA